MGEETESVITTVSKLRDTIKAATAVESNAFHGFDILTETGNYKSTYEILLGIANIYKEIQERDKELGTNNLNLLLETVAGIALPEQIVIFGHYISNIASTHLIALAA